MLGIHYNTFCVKVLLHWKMYFPIPSQNHWIFSEIAENSVISPATINYFVDKIDRNDENKKQKLYRCHSKFNLSKLIVDNGLEDLWRRENPDISFTTDLAQIFWPIFWSRIDRVYPDIKIANKTKINHKMIFYWSL